MEMNVRQREYFIKFSSSPANVLIIHRRTWDHQHETYLLMIRVERKSDRMGQICRRLYSFRFDCFISRTFSSQWQLCRRPAVIDEDRPSRLNLMSSNNWRKWISTTRNRLKRNVAKSIFSRHQAESNEVPNLSARIYVGSQLSRFHTNNSPFAR